MSSIINASGKTLTNTGSGAVYAPSTSYRASGPGVISAGPGAFQATYGINNNVSSAKVISQPGVGSFLANKSAEDSGQMREFNNSLAQYLSDLSWERNLMSARETNAFNAKMMNESNNFNKLTMQQQMAFQKLMSDTAHQREVKDLIAAGLNPVISANYGASTPSGSAISSAQAHGVSANAPVAQIDMNQYASHALMSVITDILSEFITSSFGSNVVKNTGKAIKEGAKQTLDKVAGVVNTGKKVADKAKNWDFLGATLESVKNMPSFGIAGNILNKLFK